MAVTSASREGLANWRSARIVLPTGTSIGSGSKTSTSLIGMPPHDFGDTMKLAPSETWSGFAEGALGEELPKRYEQFAPPTGSPAMRAFAAASNMRLRPLRQA